MNKIRQLDTHLTNMIAAGEVVERPAGIVKELVENAIDASSTHIEIRVKEGGMESIEVSDNGEGMSGEDLFQAFERHSTSKIRTTQDLNAILSFGFRGEALPSIASVSIVEAITNDDDNGHRLLIDNGKKHALEKAARNRGTTIRVHNLFLKTPARLKHIKNVSYENSIIQDTIQKFAMGHPDIAFSLYSDEKLTFRSYGRNDVADVFHRIYGSISQDTIQYEAENYDFKIEGIMAKPQHNRSNRYSIWLYINDRMIRYPKAQKAIADSFRRHMPTDRYPIVVMKITVDPHLVDVNVHPSKWEIRLSKEQQLLELIQSHLEEKLTEGVHAQKINFKPKESAVQQDFLKSFDIIQEQEAQKPIAKTFPSGDVEPIIVHEESEPYETIEIEPEIIEQSVSEDINFSNEEDLKPEDISIDEKTESIEPLTVLAQMSGKYILAQGDSGLYIVDQHAAMERIRYEYYQDQLLNKTYNQQDLLIPLLIEGYSSLINRLEEVNHILSAFQMNLEPFGEDTMVLRSIPTWIKDNEVKGFIESILDMIQDERTVREEDLRRRAIATLACHSSVRFNEYLSMSEMEALIASLRACRQPLHCPHGRPTLIVVEHSQLIREFNR